MYKAMTLFSEELAAFGDFSRSFFVMDFVLDSSNSKYDDQLHYLSFRPETPSYCPAGHSLAVAASGEFAKKYGSAIPKRT